MGTGYPLGAFSAPPPGGLVRRRGRAGHCRASRRRLAADFLLRNSIDLWKHSVACQETNDFAQNEYGVALADAGRIDEAMEHYRMAFEINPHYLTPRTNYAGYLYKRGKSAEALQLCEEGLKIDPNDAECHFLKAVALFGLNRPEESIHEFHVALEKNPKKTQAHNNLAEVFRLSRRYDEALAECRAALELNPEMPEAHRTMANILAAKGDDAGALEHLQTALKLTPDEPLVHEGLANVLVRQGKFQEAVEHRKRQMALQLPNTQTTIQNDVQIARRFCEMMAYRDILSLDVLAAAYADAGDFASRGRGPQSPGDSLRPSPGQRRRVTEAVKTLPRASQALKPAVRQCDNKFDKS